MKKFLSLTLAMLMLLGLVSCGSSNTGTTDAPADTAAVEESVAPESDEAPAPEDASEVDPTALSEIVTTDKGDIQGYTTLGDNGGTIYNFRGVPYAEAPVGELRWKAAQEKTAWDGVLNCTEYGATNYQFGNDLLPTFAALPQSEDCLYLNVITPAESTEEALPVMVWFHGGGYVTGGGIEETYNLTRLPEQGCIVVTVNTRLGAFGLLAADMISEEDEDGLSGNYMLSDMIASLEWVQNNIAAFGGDPDNVTIFGESGGGGKVNALLASPKAAGLFSKAIIESGISTATELTTLEEQGDQLMEALGVSTLEEARALSAEEILAASNELDMSYDFAIDNSYLNMAPLDAYAADEYNHVSLIVGVNEGELENMSQIYFFHSASVGQIEAMSSNGDSVYTYLFDQTPANWSELGGRAVHSIDLAYVFGDYENTAGTFSGGPWAMNCLYWMTDCDMTEFIEPELTDVDKELSEEVMQMWVSFATDGDPSIDGVEWDPWTSDSDNYLYITHMNGAESTMQTGYTTLG